MKGPEFSGYIIQVAEANNDIEEASDLQTISETPNVMTAGNQNVQEVDEFSIIELAVDT